MNQRIQDSSITIIDVVLGCPMQLGTRIRTLVAVRWGAAASHPSDALPCAAKEADVKLREAAWQL